MNHYTYDEIFLGQKESFAIKITDEMLKQFMSITGDNNYLHIDKNFAISLGYKSNIAYGMLTASFLSTLAGVYLPGENSLIQEVKIIFAKPVFVGDELTITGTVMEKNDIFRYMKIKVEIRNQDKIKVLRGNMQIGFLK